MYFDANSKEPLALSSCSLEDGKGALHRTLDQLYRASSGSNGSLGWICYNDEIPNTTKSDDERKGHTKGVLAFDLKSDTAFWLLHSWPKFPDIRKKGLGSADYGQTYLSITLKDVETARFIAEQMFHRQEPQAYDCYLPKSLGKDDIFYKLAHEVDVNETDPPCDITFLSKGGQHFRLMAKNRHWAKDFWIDHVGPHLKTDLAVEAWRRGTVPETGDSDKRHDVTDILYINLEKLGVPYEWHYTKDHAKWGVSKKDDWVCVADINRQTSQEKRGGGSICFQNPVLWKSLCELEQLKK